MMTPPASSADNAGGRQPGLKAGWWQTPDGAACRPAAETLGEGMGLVSYLELEGDKHPVIVISARKAGGLKTVLIQPNPHRAHLFRQLSRVDADFYSAHMDSPTVDPSATLPLQAGLRRRVALISQFCHTPLPQCGAGEGNHVRKTWVG